MIRLAAKPAAAAREPRLRSMLDLQLIFTRTCFDPFVYELAQTLASSRSKLTKRRTIQSRLRSLICRKREVLLQRDNRIEITLQSESRFLRDERIKRAER